MQNLINLEYTIYIPKGLSCPHMSLKYIHTFAESKNSHADDFQVSKGIKLLIKNQHKNNKELLQVF